MPNGDRYQSHPGVLFSVIDRKHPDSMVTENLQTDLQAYGDNNGWTLTHYFGDTYFSDDIGDSIEYEVTPRTITLERPTGATFLALNERPQPKAASYERILGALTIDRLSMVSDPSRSRLVITDWLVANNRRSEDMGGFLNPTEQDRKHRPDHIRSLGLALLEYAFIESSHSLSPETAAWVEIQALELDNRADNLIRHIGFNRAGRSNRTDYDITRQPTVLRRADPKFAWRLYRIKPQVLRASLEQDRHLSGRAQAA